jgi:hypothetical protein
MSAKDRLATALVGLIDSRLNRGAYFFRVPQFVSPFPAQELISALSGRTNVRVALFTDDADSVEAPAELSLTRDVPTAIDWRNDGGVDEALLIVGNLERDRAAGLADVATLTIEEVRRALFQEVIREMRDAAVPQAAIALMRSCSEYGMLTDLLACADYCDSLRPVDTTTAERARTELWRLGMLPDRRETEIDLRRLQQNMQLVVKLRGMDASTRQRLIRNLSANGETTEDYTAIRQFAATGKPSYLSRLDLDEVQAALRSTQQRPKRGEREPSPARTISVATVVREPDYDEDGFLSQLAEAQESEDRTITLGPLQLEWEYQNLDPIKALLGDPDSDSGYESQAGSVEHLRSDDPFPSPGKGDVEWRSLVEVAENLRILELRAGRDDVPSALLIDQLIGLRRSLLPIIESILNEGSRLFMLSGRLRSAASSLVDTWVEVWGALRELREALNLPDRIHVRRVAERLATTDLRVTLHGTEIDAYVLPLHPVVLEPRVRSAELFLQDVDLSEEFFKLVSGSLDPSMPSIPILVEGAPVSLGYSGTYKGLLHYSRQPREVDSSDVSRTLQDIVQRFVSVHPYATLSLSIGLLDPPPRVAKSLLRWLGEQPIERTVVHAYTTRRDAEEIRAALDEAKEELVSGEVPADTFEYVVSPVRSLAEFSEFLSETDQLPHLLFLFDVADVEQSGAGMAFNSPPLGSIVSEWEFDTDPLEHARPIIRPRSGSNRLTDFVAAQAGLLEMPLPSQQRSPLLSKRAERAIEVLSDRTTWVVLCEGVSSLVPPLDLGDMHLVGRMGAGNHIAFIYSGQVLLLLEPVLAYLWQNTWIDPDRDAVLEFLLGTVRMALPEGLLAFFKARGSLSRESVLGRLGFAAAVAYLEELGGADQLLVSLDSEGARRWLGLREGAERRADLVAFRRNVDGWTAEAIEVKARSAEISWTDSVPEPLKDATEQVRGMESLLQAIFAHGPGDAFTPSRREILKRQVFLEAFQQWEGIRREDEVSYTDRIDQLNKIFSGDVEVECGKRILLVNPNQAGPAEERSVRDDLGETPVVVLGVPWLRRAVEAKPGGAIEIPLDLLDELGVELGITPAGEPTTGEGTTEEPEQRNHQEEIEPVAPASRATTDDESNEAITLAKRLREVFVARNAPFRAIETEHIVKGPAVVQLPFSVPVGAKLSQLESQKADIARDLGVQSVRISNWPGHPGYAMAELPRARRVIPEVTDLTLPDELKSYPAFALGANVDFAPEWVALDELPHLLVAGTTGSGKSIFLRSLLWQLTNLYSDAELDIVLIDAKGMADYLDFMTAPHFKAASDFHSGVAGGLELLEEIVQERLPERTRVFRELATQALQETPPVQVTTLRQLLQHASERNETVPLRPLVVIIDEFAELVFASADRRRFETAVTRFVGIARAIGGHLVAATQRPSTDVVTGVMKANFARVGLRVQQSVDSRVVLDENGAEALLGRGDLLFKSANVGLVRLQGYSAIGPYAF